MKALLVLACVCALAAVAAGGAGAVSGRECAGLQTCIDVPGPWVVVPPQGEAAFLLDCPQRQGIVAGVDAFASSRDVHVSFDALLGSPVAPGRTTTRYALFRAVSAQHQPGLFQPRLGCVPASSGGPQTTAYVITPAGAPLDVAATEVLLRPGAVKSVKLGCANHERLVDSWTATAFLQPVNPALASAIGVQRVIRDGQVHVTMSASEALPASPRAFVQVGVRCAK